MTSLVGPQTRINDTSAFYIEATNSFIPVSSATISINGAGDLTVNGEDYNPRLWSNYSTVDSTISFNIPGTVSTLAQLQVQESGRVPYIYFDGNQLAYVSQIPAQDNWSLFSSISNVGIPPPYSLIADGANISTATISSLNVGYLNGSQWGPDSLLSISSINAQFTLTSTLAFNAGGINPNINLGLGPLFGNIGAWAAGGMGLVVGSAALITGTVGILLPRQTNYITQGAVEMVNVTTQLQPSTLTTLTSSITRTINGGGQEIFTSTLNTVPVNAIRSLSDPFQTPSTLSTSYVQALGQWCPLPNWAAVPALSHVNVNTQNLLSTTSMTVYNPASIGGNLRVNTGPSYGGSWFAGLPGALQPQNPNTNGPSDMRLRQLIFNDGTGYTDEIMLVNTTNSGRIGVNCATPAVATSLAYLTDGGGSAAFQFYVAKNGNDANPGTINAPFLTIGAAITARNGLPLTSNVLIYVAVGLYTENITVPRNTYLVGTTTNPDRLPVQITGTITVTDTVAGSSGIAGFLISVGNIACSTANPVVNISNCQIFASGASAISYVAGGAIFVENCRITQAGVVAVSGAGTLSMRNTTITISSANSCVNAAANATIRGCIFTNTAVSATNAAIIQVANTGAVSFELTNSQCIYTDPTTDTGTTKTCVRFNNTATNTALISNCIFNAIGAAVGAPNVQCISRVNTGAVNLTYSDITCYGNAYFISPTITSTRALPALPELPLIVQASGGTITPTLSQWGRTYILTGSTSTAFAGTNLGAQNVGFYITLKNGNNSSTDITLTGLTGATVLHGAITTGSNQTNGQSVVVYWTGAAFVGY